MYNKDAMNELKKILTNKFPNLIDKIILYGSRVEDKEEEFSDYDILLVLKKKFDWKLKKRIRDATYDVNVDYDIVTDTKLISNQDLKTEIGQLPFVQDALSKGIAI